MSESDQPIPPVPESTTVTRKRMRISLVWVIPVVAAIVGIWIAVTRILNTVSPAFDVRNHVADPDFLVGPDQSRGPVRHDQLDVPQDFLRGPGGDDDRHRADTLTLALFNFALGWTVVGWVMALRWALQPVSQTDVARLIVMSRREKTEALFAAIATRAQRRDAAQTQSASQSTKTI